MIMWNWLIKIKNWISGVFQKKEIGNVKSAVNSERTPEVEISRTPGINCPECTTRLVVSIQHLLSLEPVVCPSCGLELQIDAQKSQGALESLRKLQSGLNQAARVRQESQL
jgi:DNA-directed RNA polymerase subunit RPC12/RpoP